jgi:hypothetical protein
MKKALGITAAIGALLLVAVTAWTMRGTPAPGAAPSSDPPSATAPAGRDPERTPPRDAPGRAVSLPHTDEPDAYATAVAETLFAVDTRSLDPADYQDLLLSDADPGLSETGRADLEALVAARIPADDLWQRMRANEQRSTFEASDVWEPGSWAQVVMSGQAEPGWAMRNVTGIETTTYVEGGVEKTASRERTITIGMRCPADGADVDHCYLVLVGATVVP